MSTEEFNAILIDLPDASIRSWMCGDRPKRSEYYVTEILCSVPKSHANGPFTLGKTAAGLLVGMWESHADIMREDEKYSVLNKAELTLLEYSIKQS